MNDTLMTDLKQLRKFGFILITFIGLLGIALPYWRHHSTPTWPWILNALLLIPTLIQPAWLKAIYAPWMKLGHLLGWINTRIILGLIYFIVITPMGILMRLCGKDPMERLFDKQLVSYRKPIATPSDPQHMEKPF